MIVSLSQVAEINPKADLPAHLARDEMLDFLPMADVSETGTVFVKTKRPLSEVQKGFTAFRKGDILIAKITPCFENNKIAVADIATEVGFGSTEFHVVRCNRSRLYSRYVLHLLRSNDVRIEGKKRMTGSAGQQRVPKKFLEDLQIPLPPLEEQKRIAAILDQADELRRKRQRALDRLNQLGQSIFIEMFGDGSSFTKVALKSLGRVSTGSTPPTSELENFGGPIPFVTPSDLDCINPIRRTLSERGVTKSRTVSAGATLVCCIGSIGKMRKAETRSAFNQQINAIEWGSHIDPDFGFFSVQSQRRVIEQMGKRAATTLPIINKSEFEKLEVFKPPLIEQREFARRLRSLQNPTSVLSLSLERSETLFGALQHSAFRGEL